MKAAIHYPTTAQYIESLANADALLRTMGGISLVRDNANEPIYTAGGFGVVFKVISGDQHLAIKCFTSHQGGRAAAYTEIEAALGSTQSPHIAHFSYLENEITVFDSANCATQHPALCMEWVQGPTLTQAVRSAALRTDRVRIEQISEEFDRMALWLLDQNFAHGDIKPDNIIVRESDNTIVLIDYDGIFLPTMSGERARESGTEGFRHPSRPVMHYGKMIDHYPIALLSFSLRALVYDPSLYQRFSSGDRLLFDPQDILNHECEAYNLLIDSTLATDPLYTMLRSPNGQIDGLAGAIARDPKKSITTTPQTYDFLGDPIEGISLFRSMGRYGFVTQSGEPLCEDIFESAHNFSHGVAAVRRSGKWGYIDNQGVELTPLIYDDCGDFSEGLAAVCIGGRWGYIDHNFQVVITCRFDDAWPFSDARGLVRRGNKYGYVAANNSMAIPTRFDYAQSFSEGAACVMVDSQYGYITRSGRYIIEPQFEYAQNIKNSWAYIEQNVESRSLRIVGGRIVHEPQVAH